MKRKYCNKRVYLRAIRNHNDKLRAENLLLLAKCDYFEDIIEFQSEMLKNIFTFVKYKLMRRKVFHRFRKYIKDSK